VTLKEWLNTPRAAYTLGGIAVALLLIVLLWPTPRPYDALADKARVSAAVAEALRTNPEIVVEALQAMQSRQGQIEQMRAKQAVVANRAALEQDGNSAVGGNPRGDVTLVEFSDYRCPYCREALAIVNALMKSDPNLRVVYKEFPILGPESMIAARAAVAARSSSYYSAFHEALMTAPSPLNEEAVLKIAGSVGINVSALQLELRSPDIDHILAANHALAQEIGINGTPAFVIGDTLLPGVVSLAELQQLVANQRAMRAR
jgi:protein-disulfide isomerase